MDNYLLISCRGGTEFEPVALNIARSITYNCPSCSSQAGYVLTMPANRTTMALGTISAPLCCTCSLWLLKATITRFGTL